ncbi:MAG: aryl-sulfate sulfotransferase [Bacteroidota bacterium]
MRTTIYLFLFLIISTSLKAQPTLGLLLNQPANIPGYILFAPLASDTTYLIDKCGKRIHQWSSNYHPGDAVYFLEDGNLLRTCNVNSPTFTSGGKGGRIELTDWNSNLLWSYVISSTTECQHHDIKMLPNGNILAIVWEMKTPSEAIFAGRDSAKTGTQLWSEKIVELQPSGASSATVVWEWHVWDHLIQDYDSTHINYGIVYQHPELLNLNFVTGNLMAADWLHINSIDYNAALDQILLSSHNLSEIWVIDHSTTSLEAASHSGGNSNKGGDLLYRWGNPQSYNRGTPGDKKFFGQHNAQWIAAGLKDENKIMVFNNGLQRPQGMYSSIDIIDQPVDSAGNYIYVSGQSFLPDSVTWEYTAPVPTDFYGANISGVQRISNGNTLICTGPSGVFFEIDSMKNTVWEYISPVAATILSQGSNPTGNTVFRCTLIEENHNGLTGHQLIAGNPIELNPLPYVCPVISGVGTSASPENEITIINPVSNSINIKSATDFNNVRIQLTDLNGKIITDKYPVNLNKGEFYSVPLTNITDGVYILSINTFGKLHHYKILKSE